MYYNNPHKNDIETLEDVKLSNVKNGDVLVYEDGVFTNKEISLNPGEGTVGPIGPAGEDGKDGINGVDGKPGAQGEPGKDGLQGPAGQDGITPDISHLATKVELESAINNIVIPDVDLTGVVKQVNGTAPNEKGEVTISANQIRCWDASGVDAGNVHNYIDYFSEHVHSHINNVELDKIGESANMLTYNGKVVVNDNQYSFRSLPRAKVVNNYSTTKGGNLPWLT